VLVCFAVNGLLVSRHSCYHILLLGWWSEHMPSVDSPHLANSAIKDLSNLGVVSIEHVARTSIGLAAMNL
jgi:hypothetical protein